MLSHHEIAPLILVNRTPYPQELDPADLDTLVEREFITLEKRPSGRTWPRLTHRGQSILAAVERGR